MALSSALLLLALTGSIHWVEGRHLRAAEKGGTRTDSHDLLACGDSTLSTDSSNSGTEKAFLVDRDKYPFCHVLSADQVALYWTHDGFNRRPGNASAAVDPAAGDNVTFVVAARTTSSWLALGLSRDGTGMKGMDVALLLRDDGDPATFRLEDRYSADYSVPVLDEKQDKTLLWAKQAAGVTSFAFTMPIHNCRDTEQDVAISTDRFTHVLYAYGSSGPGAAFDYHGQDNRGAATLPLLLSETAELSRVTGRIPVPPDAKVLDVKLSDVPIDANRVTNYWCIWVELPTDVKYHVYDIELISDPRTASKVHHVSLHDCKFLAPDRPLNQPFECLEANDGCPAVAIYDRNLTVPPAALMAEAGAAWPFGANISRYWRLEVHIENAALLPDLKDSTGFRVTYSPTLRPHDLGVLVTGVIFTVPAANLTSDLVIPPGLPEYDYVNVCPSTCTKRLLPPSGVKVLNAHLHMHTHGQGGSVEVVRANGTKVMVSSTHFDANAQPDDLFTAPIDLWPGDRIITTCIYNTSDTTSDIIWGQRKSQEMCIGSLYYHPAQFPSGGCFNLQGVKHPGLDWLAKSEPSKAYSMCVKGPTDGKGALEALALVPPEEQLWQKKGLGEADKMAEIKAWRQPPACGV